MNKRWVGAGAAVALAVAAWAGSGVYIGIKAEELLNGFAAQKGAWRISNLQHNRGLFASSGQLTAAYTPGCAATPGASEGYSVQVSYSIGNLPLPTGAARFQWQLTPQGETAEVFKTLFGSASALSGQGTVGLTGALHSAMSLPQIALRRSGEVVEITPTTGSLRLDGQQLAMQWNIDRAVVRGNGQALDMQGLALTLDIDDRSKGTGSGSFKVAQASAGLGSLEGFDLSMEAREKGDRLNMNFTPAVRKLEGAGQVLTDLRMQWALNGLHTASVQTLIKLLEDSCGMGALTAMESNTAAQAMETLLAEGFSFGMPSLSGKAENGSLEGAFTVELAAAKGATPSLVEQLRSSGKLELKGPIVTPEQREMAVATGFAVAQGDSLVASYEYAKGLFKVNNRTMDATDFEDKLGSADDMVRTAMATLRNQPVTAAPAPAPVPEARPAAAPEMPVAEAPNPVAATAAGVSAQLADCTTLPACVQQTLSAAQKGDLEDVRRIATLIDTLPKPDLGNKTVARKLNTAALEALKQGDVAGAIAQLRQARQENPQDVEIAANLGFALVKANDPAGAQAVLNDALVLNPRRASTWTPLAEALALGGQMEQAKAALWVAFQWAGNRDKSLTVYRDRATKETRPALTQLYSHMANVAEAAIAQDTRPVGR